MIVGKLTSGGMLNGWGDLSGMSIDESPKGKSKQPTLVEAVMLSTRAVLQNYDARRGKTQHVEGISFGCKSLDAWYLQRYLQDEKR